MRTTISREYNKGGRMKALLLFVLVCFYGTSAFAQIKGLITQPSTTSGQVVLDPNKDGYTSASKTGFSANDVAESEIPYKALPQLGQDPSADLGPGPDCGFTDLVDLGSGEQAISSYVDANNNLLFRFRLGSSSPNSKGYSILIDTDNKFGNSGANADPNYTSTNPGFEIEVVLRTNFGVDLNDVDGRSTPLTKTTLSYNDYSQKSVAYTTNCGDYDYFYDFYIPISTITTYFPSFSSSTTAIRMVGTTVIAPKSALEGPISDLGGVNDANYSNNAAQAWAALVSNFVPTTLSGIKSGSSFSPDRSDAPVISTPITTSSVSISGTSTEALGTAIDVYKNGVLYKSTTVVAGSTWSVTGVSVASGDVITAYATATGESVSLSSAEVIVGGTTCSAPPTVNCSSDKGFVLEGPAGSAAGTIIKVYRLTTSGPQLISSGATVISGNLNIYTYKCNNNTIKPGNCTSGSPCVVDGTYYFTATEAGKCESVPSTYIVNGCTSSTTAPVITVKSTTELSGTTTIAGQTILIRIDDIFYGTATASSTLLNGTYAWSYTGFSATAGQVVSVRGIVTGGCATAAASATITEVAAAPVITTTSIATNTNSISGTSTEANGSIITIYKNGVAIGTATVNYGVWTLNAPVAGFGFTSGDVITAKVTTATNKTISDASNSVTVSAATTRIPTITSPVKESATTISGTSSSPVGTVIKLYLDGDLIGQTTVVFGSAGNTWSVTSIDPAYKLYPGGVLTATATETGLAEGSLSNTVVIQCELPVTTKTVTATNTCQTYTADVTISNPEASVLYRLKSVNGGVTTYYSSYAVALSGATTLVITTNPLPNVSTITITVEAMKIAPSSCTSDLSTTPTINVYGLPADLTVGGTTTACAGSSVNITVANSTSGISYQLRNGTTNIGTPVTGNGTTINLPTGSLNATTTYNVLATNSTTGCNRQLTNTPTVTVNAVQKTITAVNSTICSGSSTTIQVLNSENGATYQLKNGAANVGNPVTSSSEGSTISLPTGAINSTTTFSVVATKGGCTTTMTSTATVTIGNPINLPVSVSSSTICSGSSVNLTIANSELGVSYQLMLGSTPQGSAVNGTGSAITPLALATVSPTATTTSATYTYSVVATRTGGTCSSTTLTVPTITVNVQPVTKSITLSSSLICSGSSATITIGSPQTGVTYQLKSGTTNVGTPQSGATVVFTVIPTTTTTYSILAYSTTGSCSLTISVPTISVNGTKTVAAVSSTLCNGQATDITVQNTVLGVDYSLYAGSSSTAIVTIPGDGGTIGLPTGTISGTTTFNVKGVSGNGGSCTVSVGSATVMVSSPSGALTVTATNTAVCSGSATNITVGSTETGVSYQLQTSAGVNIGTPINGNGGTISLPTGALTTTTTFQVVATRSLGACVTTLTTKPTVTVNAMPLIKTVSPTSTTICNGSSATITVANVEANVSYILRNGTTVIDTKTGSAGSTVSLSSGNLTSTATFNVIAATATCTTSLGNVTVSVIAQQKNVFAEQSSLCAGSSTNILVELSGSSVMYQLRNGSTNIGSPVNGNGGTISLPTGAINSTTTFNVLAYSAAPNPVCTTFISITPTVTITTPNAGLTVSAPSSVCSGTSADITVSNSQAGVNYTLRNGVAVISTQPGNGGMLTFSSGNITSNTTFNILATNSTSGCAVQLTTTPMVEADCEAVYTPTTKTYPVGYRFSPLETLATVTDADGFSSANTSTAILTAGTLPSGVSLNTTTGEIFISSVNSIAAGNYAFGIRTTDKNGKTTDHTLSFIINSPGVPLPVEFISFNGKLDDGKVNLDWATASEINNDYFTIERSTDGIKFNEIGKQKGAGNSNQVLNYTFTDANPLNGTSYYRVKQTDFNGDFDYTKTIAIRNFRNGESSISINVFPNPVVNGTVNINLAGSQGETIQLMVVDALGKIEINKSQLMQDNFTSLNLISNNGNKLKPGVYTLITHVKNETFTTKLIIN